MNKEQKEQDAKATEILNYVSSEFELKKERDKVRTDKEQKSLKMMASLMKTS